jgi:hypothetical protein
MRWLAGSLVILGASTALAGPPRDVLVAHVWNPGFMPTKWWGRTTLTLTPAADGGVTLDLTTQRPPDEQRRDFNPALWRDEPSRTARLFGTVQSRGKAGATYAFALEQDPRAALVCTPATEPIHAAGATLAWGQCTPCYDPCKASPTWTPAQSHPRAGLSCRLFTSAQLDASGAPRKGAEWSVFALPGLPEPPEHPLFFSAAPGVELVVGKGDCPPMGYRELAPARAQ